MLDYLIRVSFTRLDITITKLWFHSQMSWLVWEFAMKTYYIYLDFQINIYIDIFLKQIALLKTPLYLNTTLKLQETLVWEIILDKTLIGPCFLLLSSLIDFILLFSVKIVGVVWQYDLLYQKLFGTIKSRFGTIILHFLIKIWLHKIRAQKRKTTFAKSIRHKG